MVEKARFWNQTYVPVLDFTALVVWLRTIWLF